MYHQQATVVDFLLPKKRRKTNPVDVGSYLGNLFAVLPLVRYYWATFCQRQFRGFRASLVFTVPTSAPLKSHNLCHFFSLPCQFFHSAVTQLDFHEFSREIGISGPSHGLGSTVGGARAASLCSRTNRSDTHTGFPGFLHRRNNRFLL